MDKILYCPGSFSTYDARFVYTQDSDKQMFQKNKDIIEMCSKYNLRLDIKVHPSGEAQNYAHFKYLSRNYPNVRVIGGYWKWFNKAENILHRYQLVIIDIIRTALVTSLAKRYIPTIIYTKRTDLLKKWELEGLRKIFHVVDNNIALDTLLYKFSFGELYLPKEEQLMKKWFERRETIQNWYKVGLKSMILRRKFRHEWKTDGTYYMNFKKLFKRLKRIKTPPKPQ